MAYNRTYQNNQDRTKEIRDYWDERDRDWAIYRQQSKKQGNDVGVTKSVFYGDPEIIKERKRKYKGENLYNILKDLGEEYNLRIIQTMFFGPDYPPDKKGWRNEIIRYFIVQRGWQIYKDPVPNWVSYKFVSDENGNETLIVYTPLTGRLAIDAVFGFVKWDLKYPKGKNYFYYTGDKNTFNKAQNIQQLERDNDLGLNHEIKNVTKRDIIFSSNYPILESKAAIAIAYELVFAFQNNNYIKNPNSLAANSYISHHKLISIEQILGSENDTKVYPKETQKVSRRDYFGSGNNKETIDKSNKKTEETPFFYFNTNLYQAKKIFIEGEYKYSSDELAEEGLAANNLIQHFHTFKMAVRKAVLMYNSYGSLSENARSKIGDALYSFQTTIINAYLFPMEKVSFEKGNQLLEEVAPEAKKEIFGKDGEFKKLQSFAKESLEILKESDEILLNLDFVEKIVNNEKDEISSGEGLDIKSYSELGIAISLIKVMSQKNGLSKIISVIEKSNQTPPDLLYSYYDEIYDIEVELSGLILNYENSNTTEERSLIRKKIYDQISDFKKIFDEDYAEMLQKSIQISTIGVELDQMEKTAIFLLSTVATLYLGSALSQIVGPRLASFFASTRFSGGVSFLSKYAAEPFFATMLQNVVESIVLDKEFGEDFEKDFAVDMLLNVAFFKVLKLSKVSLARRSINKLNIPNNAEQISDGVWVNTNVTIPELYVDESLFKQIDLDANKVLSYDMFSDNFIDDYSEVNKLLREKTELSKVRALNEDLIKNSLRKVETETLEYFESNPLVFENALQKLDEELLNIGPVQRVAYSSRYLDNLAAAGKKLDNPTEKVEVLAHHGDDVTSASGSTGRSGGPNDVKGRDADKTTSNKGDDIDPDQLQNQNKKSSLDVRSLDDVDASKQGRKTDTNVTKSEVDEIVGLVKDPELKSVLKADLESSPQLAKKLINTDYLDAWETCFRSNRSSERLDPEFLNKIISFKRSFKQPSRARRIPEGAEPPYIFETPKGNKISFNENGFPNFKEYAAGKEYTYVSDNLKGHMEGSTDFKDANKFLKDKVGKSRVRNVKGGNFELKINGQWKRYTWHHHEDGKTLMPVLFDIHNKTKPHTGGASIIKNNLQGMYPSPY